MTNPQRLDVVPEEVLATFGVAGSAPARLAGGQGITWRAGPMAHGWTAWQGIGAVARAARPVTDLILARLAR